MARSSDLESLLRSEIGDRARSFVWSTLADGITNRFEIPHAPVDGLTLVVQVEGVDLSADCEVEEGNGILTLDEIPQSNAQIVVAGTSFKYFTPPEIATFISTAFVEHTNNNSLSTGARYTLDNLPPVEEYPLVVLASSLALQTLATDASFDIDISAPDGVLIPRSQRYRQLMEMAEMRRQQYRELCVALNIGLWRIETHVVRRVSNRTNRLSPLYIPQEIDDRSTPARIRIPIPTYGAVLEPSDVYNLDLSVVRGDDYESPSIDFPFDLTHTNIDAQIRDDGTDTVLRAVFTIDVPDPTTGVLYLRLSADETRVLPPRAYWDLQVTDLTTNKITTYFRGKVFTQGDITRQSDPRASGWRGIP